MKEKTYIRAKENKREDSIKWGRERTQVSTYVDLRREERCGKKIGLAQVISDEDI